MKTEIQYRWRILWSGRWGTTGYHCTEDQIRKEHPEAVRIDASRRELQIAETFDERKNAMFRPSAFVKQPATEGR
jgi:hypothetical protein